LISHEVITNLIANTTAQYGLKIHTGLAISQSRNLGIDPIGLKIIDDDLTGRNLKVVKFLGGWNYTLLLPK